MIANHVVDTILQRIYHSVQRLVKTVCLLIIATELSKIVIIRQSIIIASRTLPVTMTFVPAIGHTILQRTIESIVIFILQVRRQCDITLVLVAF